MLSLADLRLVHTEETDIPEDVEVEELLVAEARAKLPLHEFSQHHAQSRVIDLLLPQRHNIVIVPYLNSGSLRH